MPQIQCLAPHVADLIAAGEVVERPASVIKELLENAMDAGASAVVVELQNGGLTYLRVTDNGCGIAPQQLPTAFLRHATSKLRTAEDLAAIGTLGFRGEALAAIAAVSRVDVFSREKGAVTGASLRLEGGTAGEVTETGCPEGTTICVRDLFFNTPARMKFMRRDSAEASAITNIVTQLALSHPEVAFQLIRDGDSVLHTPGDGLLHSAIYAALGRDFAMNLLPVRGAGGEIAVEGFVTKPLAGHGTRARQIFFVNGRLVKSQLLTAALEEAYRNRLLKGKFPGCVLHVTLPADQLDVNVHPAKTVVKFLSDKSVFDAVYHTIQDKLTAGEKPAQSQARPMVQAAVANAAQEAVARTAPRQETFYQTMSVQQFKDKTAPQAEQRHPLGAYVVRPSEVSPDAKLPVRDVVSVTAQPVEKVAEPEVQRAPVVEESRPAEIRPVMELPVEEPQQTLQPGEAPWRIVGEVLETYIICQDDKQNVHLIDKHAAHERIRFDWLKENAEPLMSQPLLAPLAVTLSAEDHEAVLAGLETLAQFGFACEDFGDNTILVREVPSQIPVGEVASTLEELAQGLRMGRVDPESARDSLLQTMACKSAIKAGMHSDPAELAVLVEQVQSGCIRYCPHGRPVSVQMTRYEIEKMFKRA